MILLSLNGFSQEILLDINNHADCNSMMQIETRRTVGPTTSPQGYGSKLEFKNNSREELYFMEKENNTVWYKFTAKTNGNLTFELEPLDSLNDYDFTLYKYTDKNFCQDVLSKTILPIRTNFSRNKPGSGSRTGLSITAEKEFVTAGINPAYSTPVKVLPNEEYVLLVNNVYKDGAGHILHFGYTVNLNLNGSVVDVEGEGSLEANITLTNTKTGDIVATATSDSTTGTYKLTFDLPKSELNDPMHLEVLKDGYFFQDTVIKAYDIATKMRDVKLHSKIKKLKKGDSFVVNNFLFHGNSPKPLPRSLSSFKALAKTMKRNKTLKISIEGHTNGCSHGTEYSMGLSKSRAETIFNFLLKEHISKNRLSSIGYGCQYMLYSEEGNRAFLNRRVEIEIVDL